MLVVGAGTADGGDPDAPIGNGRAIVVRCGREGAHVVCADMSESSAAATAALVEAEGATAEVVVADVAHADECDALIAGAGAITGLVLNVGIGRGGGLSRTSADDWDATFAVNLRSHFLVAQAALPTMAEGGSIVFISSVAGLQPGSRLPAYDASKAGIIGLGRHVAMEGARRGVRANVVAPGSSTRRSGGRLRRAPVARAHARAARPPRHGMGGRGRRRVPAVRRRVLRHRPDVLTVDGGLHLDLDHHGRRARDHLLRLSGGAALMARGQPRLVAGHLGADGEEEHRHRHDHVG